VNLESTHVLHSKFSTDSCSPDSTTFANAVINGNLEIIKWLHEIGCSWNEKACEYAIEQQNAEVLIWLHENGCLCNDDCRYCKIVKS